MRGFLQPGKRVIPSEAQSRFASLSRGRRTHLAKAANTTLVKADQWARGAGVPGGVGEALERALASLKKQK